MAYFLDWKNTHFHDDQMLSALCITQYRLLKEKNELYNPNLEEPKYFDWCPWLSMVGILHINSLHNLHDARDNFRDGVIAPDKEDGMNNVPVYHFDGEQFQQTNLRLMTDLQNIISLIKVDDATFVSNLPSIRRQIAINIHGIQDFYAHTNWVELGYTNIISQLGFKNVMSQIPVANGAKCKECEKTDMTAEELEEYTKLNNSWIYKPLLEHIHSLIDFKLDRVYVCRNNTINNGVTSGYYGAELGNAQKSQGQCSHGVLKIYSFFKVFPTFETLAMKKKIALLGGTDSSAGQSAKGGISKDADTLFFAPHYYNHEAAAKLATTASIEYFANLRSSILDDDKFGQILGLKVPNSIAIMIDTTGSMQYSIEAAKTAAKNLVISSNSSNLFYLIPVNDPDYGPVLTYTNVTDMVNMIDTLDADGGGDTPEQQFPALLQTLLTVRQSTPIYVFTDSTSHHQELLPQIQKLAASKKIAITFMMTGENGFVKSFGNFTQKPILGQELDTDTISTIDDYKSLSLGTGGIYLLTNNENINSTSKVVSQTNWQTLIFENIQYQANQTWSFPVDDTTLKVQVVIVANLNSYLSYLNISLFASGIDLMKNNNTVLLNLTTIRAYEFDATDFSTWTLNINNLYSYYGYTVTIRASSTFDSKMTIIDTSGAILAGQPLATSSYNFFFDCSDCKNIDKVNFKSCQSNLPILINNNTVSKMNNRNEWYVTNVTFPVSTQVCIEIFGQTKGSKLFQRLVQEKLFVSTVSIELNIVSNNASYGSVFPQQNTSIIYNLANTGTQNDTFGVTVTTSNLNFKIWNFNNTVFVPSNGSINGLIIITADGSIGDFTTIGVGNLKYKKI
uniref:VWFA domain-containing protein n=1 Tax=Panagrolaimus sp. ES5 TaxID=591445 RepID=A0AC34F135_9BILA